MKLIPLDKTKIPAILLCMPENQDNLEITINNDRKISAPAGVSILQALKQNNIFLSSACGGRGICGLCRLKVLEGAPAQLTQAETVHLNPEEVRAGFRLACQIKLEQDAQISIPDSFFNAREFRAEVRDIRDLTRDIKEFKLRLLSPPEIAFKSGQYIQLRIPPYATSKKITYRAYSIASPPSDNQTIELQVRRVRNGIATTYLFEYLKESDNISFNGPHGDFYLRDGASDIVMIAGGSGMAPIKSMLADMRDRKIARKTRFFFGGRTPADIFYRDLMKQFDRALPDFKFIPSVSSVRPDEKWEGEMGLITDVLERRLEAGFAGVAYLCGSPAMIAACIAVLCKKKVSEERMFYDKFA